MVKQLNGKPKVLSMQEMGTTLQNSATKIFGGKNQVPNIDLTLGHYTEGQIGIIARLLNNREGAVCNQTLRTPQSYCILPPNSKIAIRCMWRINDLYPNPPSIMAPNTMNILHIDVQFGEIVPIFPDDPTLNLLVFKSFTANLDDIGDVVYHLGKGNSEEEFFEKYFEDNTHDKEIWRKREKRLDQIIVRIKDHDKAAVIKNAAVNFKNESHGFEDILDTKRHLLCSSNGIYVFDKDEFREARSSDYLTISAGYDLQNNVDIENRNKFISFLNSIMLNNEELHHLLNWLASCINGRKNEEIFTILTGDGCNGNSVLCDLMHATMGGANGYSHPISVTMLTSERPGSASPCPDLLNLQGKRWTYG
ncbi:hypothetical protein BDK51DRAFT_38964 [Blyttiomyces helicus]|uniref:Bacteriophage/plasmid primase P4 C-terminal domain-containing protein n=1 Tax=Blyttiomyces helicus TaxID=388810 RepID=A0A4P9WL01_9FUNG|nr:hypothetical protein BDK51DRAFT_38964 [Blyttiomyces helicus]|eukprot:RKO93514.1 hypothetical protein BDK51DRAFT_38964 [Blyttiomyces helicus]